VALVMDDEESLHRVELSYGFGLIQILNLESVRAILTKGAVKWETHSALRVVPVISPTKCGRLRGLPDVDLTVDRIGDTIDEHARLSSLW
jgi:hypothetical protein